MAEPPSGPERPPDPSEPDPPPPSPPQEGRPPGDPNQPPTVQGPAPGHPPPHPHHAHAHAHAHAPGQGQAHPHHAHAHAHAHGHAHGQPHGHHTIQFRVNPGVAVPQNVQFRLLPGQERQIRVRLAPPQLHHHGGHPVPLHQPQPPPQGAQQGQGQAQGQGQGQGQPRAPTSRTAVPVPPPLVLTQQSAQPPEELPPLRFHSNQEQMCPQCHTCQRGRPATYCPQCATRLPPVPLPTPRRQWTYQGPLGWAIDSELAPHTSGLKLVQVGGRALCLVQWDQQVTVLTLEGRVLFEFREAMRVGDAFLHETAHGPALLLYLLEEGFREYALDSGQLLRQVRAPTGLLFRSQSHTFLLHQHTLLVYQRGSLAQEGQVQVPRHIMFMANGAAPYVYFRLGTAHIYRCEDSLAALQRVTWERPEETCRHFGHVVAPETFALSHEEGQTALMMVSPVSIKRIDEDSGQVAWAYALQDREDTRTTHQAWFTRFSDRQLVLTRSTLLRFAARSGHLTHQPLFLEGLMAREGKPALRAVALHDHVLLVLLHNAIYRFHSEICSLQSLCAQVVVGNFSRFYGQLHHVGGNSDVVALLVNELKFRDLWHPRMKALFEEGPSSPSSLPDPMESESPS